MKPRILQQQITQFHMQIFRHDTKIFYLSDKEIYVKYKSLNLKNNKIWMKGTINSITLLFWWYEMLEYLIILFKTWLICKHIETKTNVCGLCSYLLTYDKQVVCACEQSKKLEEAIIQANVTVTKYGSPVKAHVKTYNWPQRW